jgi:hypothetical protein
MAISLSYPSPSPSSHIYYHTSSDIHGHPSSIRRQVRTPHSNLDVVQCFKPRVPLKHSVVKAKIQTERHSDHQIQIVEIFMSTLLWEPASLGLGHQIRISCKLETREIEFCRLIVSFAVEYRYLLLCICSSLAPTNSGMPLCPGTPRSPAVGSGGNVRHGPDLDFIQDLKLRVPFKYDIFKVNIPTEGCTAQIQIFKSSKFPFPPCQGLGVLESIVG